MNDINTLNYSYNDSLIARLNSDDLSDSERLDLLTEIVTLHDGYIDALERKVAKLMGTVEYDEY